MENNMPRRISVKSASEIAEKWALVTPQRASYYAAEADMAKGVADYVAVLEGLEIPDRGPRGSVANYAIVEKVGSALHAKRLAVLAATS